MSEFLPKLYVLRLLLAILAWNVSDVFSDDQVVRLGDRFDSESARVSTILIARTAGEDSSTVFASLSRPDRAIFLDVFWESRNPLIHKYYYGLHFGRRRFSVSDSFFERMTVVPELFKRRAEKPAPDALVEADSLGRLLVTELPTDPFARCALGYILLEEERFEEADQAFLEALKIDRKFAEARNGRGLAQLALGKRATKALEEFRNAAVLDRAYAAAQYNIAMTNLILRSLEIGRSFELVIEILPTHPDAHFKLGAFHQAGAVLEKDPDFARAAEAYQHQVEVNPDHVKAWFQLGSVLLQSDRAQDAIDMWERLINERPSFRDEYLPLLLEAYQKAGHPKLAEETADEYIANLDVDTQNLFKDITIIATPDEQAEYGKLDRWDRISFVRKFWQKRDPSPSTVENERRVEHYRRLIYAMQTFGEVRKPWDRRGEVYIRYGEPDHKSQSDNVRFEFAPDVVKVKDRLQNRLPGSAQREIIARSRRIRQSIREQNPGQREVSDFESVEFELSVAQASSGLDGGQGQSAIGQNRLEGGSYGEGSLTTLDRLGAGVIRGLPLFPVEPNKPWEYWIYPYVGGGVEIVFVSLSSVEDFDYPVPPAGRAESSKNAMTWTRLRPDNIVASAVKEQGEVYEQPTPTIEFFVQSADFMGDGKNTRLELYYGIPLEKLSVSVPDTGALARGLAVFDLSWKPLYRAQDTIRYLAEENTKQIAVSERALNLLPGEYLIGTQYQDVGGESFGSRYKRIEVGGYVPGEFEISDIELASEIFEDYASAMKGGLGVIPNPMLTYRRDKPVLVYYEVYGLTKDAFGQTRYEVTYSITPTEHDGRFLSNVLRSVGKVVQADHKETVTITTEQAGYRTDQSEYIELEVTKTAAGEYDLSVTVRDLVSLKSVTKQTAFTIYVPGN